MADAATYNFIKNCLFKFDYPNIHSRANMEIVDVLSTPNREFLIRWIFKKIGVKSDETFLDCLNAESLGELVHCYGFCAESECQGFMHCSLPEKQQGDILYRMFMYLCNVQLGDLPPPLPTLFQDVDYLNYLQTADTNLFPMYGPKVGISVEERRKKQEEYQKQVEAYKKFCGRRVAAAQKDNAAFLEKMDFLTTKAFENCEIHLSEFRKNAQMMANCMNAGEKKDGKVTVDFNVTGQEIIEQCDQNINTIKKYIQSLNDTKACSSTSSNSGDSFTSDNDVNPRGNHELMMKSLALLYINKEHAHE